MEYLIYFLLILGGWCIGYAHAIINKGCRDYDDSMADARIEALIHENERLEKQLNAQKASGIVI